MSLSKLPNMSPSYPESQDDDNSTHGGNTQPSELSEPIWREEVDNMRLKINELGHFLHIHFPQIDEYYDICHDWLKLLLYHMLHYLIDIQTLLLSPEKYW